MQVEAIITVDDQTMVIHKVITLRGQVWHVKGKETTIKRVENQTKGSWLRAFAMIRVQNKESNALSNATTIMCSHDRIDVDQDMQQHCKSLSNKVWKLGKSVCPRNIDKCCRSFGGQRSNF